MEEQLRLKLPNTELLKRIINQDGADLNRLKSLKLPRDLTLGGTKPRKLFTPNLNVVRNKNREQDLYEKRRQERNARSETRRNAKRAKQQSNLVQSDGIFSQGIGEGKRPRISSERTSASRAASINSSALSIPVLNTKRSSVNKNEEKLILENLLANDDSDSDSDSDTSMSVSLPLELSISDFKQTHDLKSEDVLDSITKEISDRNPGLPNEPKIKVENTELNFSQTSSCLKTPRIYDDENPAFTFIKLPDTFPGKVWKDDLNDKDKALEDIHDGYMGKIVIRQSGKMELQVKNTKYNLNADTVGNTTSGAVLFPGEESISMEPSLVTLGIINEALTLTPDWDSLFNHAKKNPKFYF